ncbi:MAG: tRNA preQ1(34) S-adenosylmethionine ribosyltransferase-isomerase QueA [Nitrospinota bacterium]|nr:tRNA preQ1(34) S-adenosylmethionine ribosyltransferase-isomerase QueA [Nitrospinota bacterium]
MKLSDFDFHLPKELIAQTPSPNRGESRLLVVDRATASIEHSTFGALPGYLEGHPVIAFNNTRVLPAKLFATLGEQGKSIEVLLVKEIEPGIWKAMMKNLKKLKPGQQLIFGTSGLQAVFVERLENIALIRFNTNEGFEAQLEQIGKMPLPHYIHRSPEDMDTEKLDRERYQTVFARHTGAIAAPTAGLHFTREMLDQLTKFAELLYLTLHVGPGTFQPVREEADVRNHQMMEEYFNIPVETWNGLLKAKRENRKIMAVGTTATRVLESVELKQEKKSDVSGWTDRFIYPGQTFNNTDHLLTNFHLPKSTLYMLVCALAGPMLMQKAYTEAIREKYRFFSYGDAMLIL